MLMGGYLLLLRFSMKRAFDPWSRLVLSSYMCVNSSGQACGGGWWEEPSVSSTIPPSAGQGAGREEMSHSLAGWWAQDEQGAAQAPWTSMPCRELVGWATQHLEHCPSGCMQGVGQEERSQGRVGWMAQDGQVPCRQPGPVLRVGGWSETCDLYWHTRAGWSRQCRRRGARAV